MGENEQGGMLRTVVVVGLIAMVALIVILSVVGLKSNLRTNTLMAETMGQNILKIDPNNSDHYFTKLGGYETMTYDSDSGMFTLTLSTKSQYDSGSQRGSQGMYYGPGSTYSPKGYDAFIPGDKYYMSADMRVVDGDSSKLTHQHMNFQSSNVTMSINPTLNHDWQHYETAGIRMDTWGAPVIEFINDSDGPITIQIKNIQLIRRN